MKDGRNLKSVCSWSIVCVVSCMLCLRRCGWAVGKRAARLCVPAVGGHGRVSWRQGKTTLRTSECAQLRKISAVKTKN